MRNLIELGLQGLRPQRTSRRRVPPNLRDLMTPICLSGSISSLPAADDRPHPGHQETILCDAYLVQRNASGRYENLKNFCRASVHRFGSEQGKRYRRGKVLWFYSEKV